MHLLINERSVTSQAENPYVADLLLLGLADALTELEPRRMSDADDPYADPDRIFSHSSLFFSYLCPQATIEHLLFAERDHESATLRRLRTARTFLLRNLRNGPYIDTVLNAISHICEGQEDGVPVELANTAIAGSVHFEGILISFQRSSLYPPGDLRVHYLANNRDEEVEIEHYVEVTEIRARRRRFWPHPKHNAALPTYGVRDTPMDLANEVAEEVLNKGIPIGSRVFGCVEKGKIYVFPRHGPNEYHGYPVDVRELQKRAGAIYSRLRALGWCD